MNYKLLLLTLFLIPSLGFSQKIKYKGDIKSLKEVTEYDVEFIFEGMAVGKFNTEKEYTNKKVSEYNEKEEGKGDTWLKNWEADRENRYIPKFLELINKTAKEKFSVEDKDTDYVMIVKTTFTEPGYNVGVWRKDASIDLEITIKKKNDENPIVTFTLKKAPGRGGMGYDFDTGYRIEQAYAKAGKSFGKFLRKKGY